MKKLYFKAIFVFYLCLPLVVYSGEAEREVKRIKLSAETDEPAIEAKLSIDEAVSICSQNMATILRAMIATYSQNAGVIKFPWLPGYIVKTNTSRIEYARMLKDCIEKHNLNLGVPEKRKCLISDKDREIVPNYFKDKFGDGLCIAEYIEGSQNIKLTRAQTQQKVTLFAQAEKPYIDSHSKNFVYTSEGKPFIIDTDAKGFEVLPHRKGSALQDSLCYLYVYNQFEEDAKDFLTAEIKRRFPDARIGEYYPWDLWY